jgi:D-3-phosphoglycerate dehydrogenase
VKVLVVGDSYMPVEVFRRAFERLDGNHRFDYLQLDMGRTRAGATPSELRIREYAGSPEQIVERLADHEGLVVHGGAVTDAVLDAAPGLRLVCCARGGPVNVDVAAATERGVPVATTPGKNAEAVADLTIAFLVILARGVTRAAAFLSGGGRVGDSTFEGAEWFGHDLGGHLLGLVGYGQVGRRVALRAIAMGMQVASFDPNVEAGAIAADGVRAVEFAQLLEEARFVSLHARQPIGAVDMFGAAEFAHMRSGAFFVNTARETLVDEEALFTALSSGHLAGAALDVLHPRPPGEVNPLLALANVVATPHIGGATVETLDRGAAMVADEIERFERGSQLVNVINPEALAP